MFTKHITYIDYLDINNKVIDIYVENHGYMSIEEDVLVTKDGCVFLSD